MSEDILAKAWGRTIGTDRKQFNLFFENMLDGFSYNKIILNSEGKPIDYIFLEVNEAFEKMTGLKKERITGKKASEIFKGIKKDLAKWIATYGKVALACKSIQFEDFTKPLGKWFHVSAYCPEKGYFVTLLEDITERKKAEHELFQAKNDWERTFDTIPDFIAILDNKHRIVRANRAMAEQLGVTAKQAVGLNCYECVHGTSLPPEFCPHAKTLKDGKEHVEEVHESRLGGDFLVSTTPIKDEQGRVTGSVHVARNITERKKTEKEISRLASFPTLNPNAIFEADFRGNITYANPATKNLFPDIQELKVKHPFLAGWNDIARSFETETRDTVGREVKVAEHWYHETFYFVPETKKIRVCTMDIDEQKKTEEARAKVQVKLEENAVLVEEYASQMEELAEQRAEQLKNSERLAAIGQTAGMVGHDIRNPLQAITGDMYLIKEELNTMPESKSKQEIFESIDAINENLSYINKIVSDLQDYTRPLKPSIQEANLSELIEGTISTITVPK
ncbi:MAG TPA: PAS domain S-box protein, partial [Candidatus Acidoferrum sp.]|nr:PAS domain S-box protein [Candidatus Acidoferrum sp.]